GGRPAAPEVRARPPGAAGAGARPAPRSPPGPARAEAAAPRERPIRWRWPVDGPVLRRFGEGPVPGRGIQIGGRPGQPVRAAADGVVVYAGRGLPQYGALVIIKHDRHYLSAYGHNQALLVREGERVRAGQRIATLGAQGGRALLHFEIRYDGRPRDPLRLLPRR
ncbi:MAG: peptidase M23, partial [Gammaproteobacteria bacterium]